jgi:ankyrin repeat protein
LNLIPSFQAIRSDCDETLELLLLREDIDVNYVNRFGDCALSEAVTYRRYHAARCLLATCKAKVTTSNPYK